MAPPGTCYWPYHEGLLAGDALIRLPVLADQPRDVLVEILRRHGATAITHVSGGGMESTLSTMSP